MANSESFDNYSLEYDKWFENHGVEYEKELKAINGIFTNRFINIG